MPCNDSEHHCRQIAWRFPHYYAVCLCGHEEEGRPTLSEAKRDAYRHWKRLPPILEEFGDRDYAAMQRTLGWLVLEEPLDESEKETIRRAIMQWNGRRR